MQQVTIGPKYQIVIPKEVRKKHRDLKPGNKVRVKSKAGGTITVEPVIQNWSDANYGKFKKYLRGATVEVERMRDEWEERLREIEKSR